MVTVLVPVCVYLIIYYHWVKHEHSPDLHAAALQGFSLWDQCTIHSSEENHQVLHDNQREPSLPCETEVMMQFRWRMETPEDSLGQREAAAQSLVRHIQDMIHDTHHVHMQLQHTHAVQEAWSYMKGCVATSLLISAGLQLSRA